MEHPKDKLFYSIGEVAKMFGVTQSLIRYWETEFPVIKPHRNKKGTRFYTPKEVDKIHLIFHLVKERGYTLQGAKQKLADNTKAIDDNFEIVKRLKNIRTFLVKVDNELK